MALVTNCDSEHESVARTFTASASHTQGAHGSTTYVCSQVDTGTIPKCYRCPNIITITTTETSQTAITVSDHYNIITVVQPGP